MSKTSIFLFVSTNYFTVVIGIIENNFENVFKMATGDISRKFIPKFTLNKILWLNLIFYLLL